MKSARSLYNLRSYKYLSSLIMLEVTTKRRRQLSIKESGVNLRTEGINFNSFEK